MQKQTRFVIVGFDGLRPDSIENDMPVLAKFLNQSHRWTQYLASFPTETYVNHPSIFSGFKPGQHGIIANAYFDRRIDPDKAVFRGNRVDSIMAHESALNGVVSVPSLGDRLGAAGKTMRVICANSSGSTRLQHIHADRYDGHMNCCVHDLSLAIPACEREALQAKWGGGNPLTFPDFVGTEMVADIFFEYELPRGLADVTVLWIGEPDHSCHEFGINDEKTIAARKVADATFARIYDWWEREGKNSGVQLVTMSDHGHGEVSGHADLSALLREKGYNVVRGKDFSEGKAPDNYDIVMVGDYACGLWFKDPTAEKLADVRDILMASPDCGMIFSQPSTDAVEGLVEGTFSEALVFSDNERGPDLRVIYRDDPITGTITMEKSIDIGCSNHGGLLPQAIKSVLAIAGDQFNADEKNHEQPAGHDDFATTVMTILGLLDDENTLQPVPTARILTEAIKNEPVSAIDHEYLQLTHGSFVQYLKRVHYHGHIYVREGARKV